MKRLFALIAALIVLAGSQASAKLQIVTTTQDLGSIAQSIGGDAVEVFTIAKGYQDPHFVDPKPSYILKLKRADLLMVVGLELEVGWLPPLLQNSRNARILPGNPGFFDASEGTAVLQRPAGTIDRSMGDVHPMGNPHYWTDPENGRTIAQHLAARLIELDPSRASGYSSRLKSFEAELATKQAVWQKAAASFKGSKVVTYHNSWPNFAKAFGLDIVNHVEPKPGIPPSPSHVQSLIEQIKREKIAVVLIEPYFDDKLPRKIGQETGAKVLIFPPSVGGVPEVKTYFDLFDYDLKLLSEALGGKS